MLPSRPSPSRGVVARVHGRPLSRPSLSRTLRGGRDVGMVA
ncbi:hypothetical protein NO222_05530 [Gluconacetobacter entanii]|nr:hypothetical protein [Gluconacetobacter entanii]